MWAGEERECGVSRGGDEGKRDPKAGPSVVEMFVAGEGRASSPLVAGPSAGAEITHERPTSEAGGFRGRGLLSEGVNCTGLESKFGTVFDL